MGCALLILSLNLNRNWRERRTGNGDVMGIGLFHLGQPGIRRQGIHRRDLIDNDLYLLNFLGARVYNVHRIIDWDSGRVQYEFI